MGEKWRVCAHFKICKKEPFPSLFHYLIFVFSVDNVYNFVYNFGFTDSFCGKLCGFIHVVHKRICVCKNTGIDINLCKHDENKKEVLKDLPGVSKKTRAPSSVQPLSGCRIAQSRYMKSFLRDCRYKATCSSVF